MPVAAGAAAGVWFAREIDNSIAASSGCGCAHSGLTCKVFACGQLQRHRIEEDVVAADLMTFTKARSEDCLDGQETYHFIASA